MPPSPKVQLTVPVHPGATVTLKVFGLQPETVIALNGLGTFAHPGLTTGQVIC